MNIQVLQILLLFIYNLINDKLLCTYFLFIFVCTRCGMWGVACFAQANEICRVNRRQLPVLLQMVWAPKRPLQLSVDGARMVFRLSANKSLLRVVTTIVWALSSKQLWEPQSVLPYALRVTVTPIWVNHHPTSTLRYRARRPPAYPAYVFLLRLWSLDAHCV